MRGRRQNGEKRGSALQQQGRRPHAKEGQAFMGASLLLRLLVLLAAQQGFHLVEGKSLSRFILQPAAVVVGTLLAPQPAQAQSITLTATPLDGGRVRLDWTRRNISGLNVRQWGYQQNGGAWIRIPGDGNTLNHTVTGLKVGVAYSFQVILFASTSGPSIIVGTESNVATATPFVPPVLSTRVNPDGGVVMSWSYSGPFPSGAKWQNRHFSHPPSRNYSFRDAAPAPHRRQPPLSHIETFPRILHQHQGGALGLPGSGRGRERQRDHQIQLCVRHAVPSPPLPPSCPCEATRTAAL